MNPITTKEYHAGYYTSIKSLLERRVRRISVERQMRYESANGWDIYSLDAHNHGIVLNRDPFPTRKAALAVAKEIFGANCLRRCKEI
jgi:hypothetical protein